MTCAVPGLVGPAMAAPPAGLEAAANETFMVVRDDNTPVRSSSSPFYYAITTLKSGTVVRTSDIRRGFVGVLLETAAFSSLPAYLRIAADRDDLIESDDTGKATVLTKTDIVGPNMDAENPALDSWKRIGHLPAGASVKIRRTEQDGPFNVYVIDMPATARGWIDESHLDAATPQQVVAYRAAMSADVLGVDEPKVTAPQAPVGDPIEAPPAAGSSTDDSATDSAQTPADPQANTATQDPPAETGTTTDPELDMSQPTTIEPAPAPAAAPPSGAKRRLDVLEESFETLKAEPIETAEVAPLRELYLDLARDVETESAVVARFARARFEQLTIWGELQERTVRINALRQKLAMTSAEVTAARRAAETTGGYAAVGRLAASTIFEGTRLPRLLRLQDAATGRTIAYLRPDDSFDFTSMLGQLIGVVGSTGYDEGVRLNIIRPRRIDLLMAEPKAGPAPMVSDAG